MPSILVIDDEEAVRQLLRLRLEAEGDSVDVARNGAEGIRRYRESRWDFVVCDLFMPEKEGLETIRELRRESRPSPIVAIRGGGFRGGDAFSSSSGALRCRGDTPEANPTRCALAHRARTARRRTRRVVAAVLRAAIDPLLGESVVFLQNYPVVMLSAWYGGQRAGWLATALCAGFTAWLFLPPDQPFSVVRPSDQLGLAFVIVAGVLVCALSEQLHQSRWRAEANTEELRRQEAAARRTAARQRAMLESAFDAVVGMDDEGRIQEWNLAAERVSGRTRGEVIGRDLAEVIIPERLGDRHRAGLRRYLAGWQPSVLDRRVELPALRSDASELPAEAAVTCAGGRRARVQQHTFGRERLQRVAPGSPGTGP